MKGYESFALNTGTKLRRFHCSPSPEVTFWRGMRIFWSKILWTRSSTKKLYQRPQLIQGCWMVLIFQVSMKKHLLGRIGNLCFGIFGWKSGWKDAKSWMRGPFWQMYFFSDLVFASSVCLVQVLGFLPLFWKAERDGTPPPLQSSYSIVLKL